MFLWTGSNGISLSKKKKKRPKIAGVDIAVSTTLTKVYNSCFLMLKNDISLVVCNIMM